VKFKNIIGFILRARLPVGQKQSVFLEIQADFSKWIADNFREVLCAKKILSNA
jgi:hypothetical protein